MTREEHIIQASDEWTYQKPPQYSELVHKTHKVMCAYQVGFIDGAVWADTHPHWISVKDELPPKEGPSCSLSINVLATDGNFIHKDFYDYNLKKWYRVNDWGYDYITHWIPPPLPPAKLSSLERIGKNRKEAKNELHKV